MGVLPRLPILSARTCSASSDALPVLQVHMITASIRRARGIGSSLYASPTNLQVGEVRPVDPARPHPRLLNPTYPMTFNVNVYNILIFSYFLFPSVSVSLFHLCKQKYRFLLASPLIYVLYSARFVMLREILMYPGRF